MNRASIVGIAVGLVLRGHILAAQSVADRVNAAPDGIVRIAYAARPGVCGDGHSFIRDRSRGDNATYGSYNSDDDRKGKCGWNNCEDGPVRVALSVRGHQVSRIRVYVGGTWPAATSGTVDLGMIAAHQAFDYLLGMASDPRHSAGEEGVFAATIADSVTAWPSLLHLARNTTAPRRSREQAVFWLGQLAGDAATKGLSDFIEDDAEDRQVREHAVFALSQLPHDTGVPVLVKVARTNKDPEIRRKALFWLGQSEDPRALALFEEILSKR